MNEILKYNERCVKVNTTYFKSKINHIINDEITEYGADKVLYQDLNSCISKNFLEFSNKIISGEDFQKTMTALRDNVINKCGEMDEVVEKRSEIEKKPSEKMRPLFKNYIFDKIYSMGINIKKEMVPDNYEQELEEEKRKLDEEENNRLEEEEIQKAEEEEKIKAENEIKITVEGEEEEKRPDIVDQMFEYFFGNPYASSSKTEKKPEIKENKVKGE